MSQYFLFQFRIIILCFFKMSLINQLQTTNYWALIALLNVCNNLDKILNCLLQMGILWNILSRIK